ncbi:hypothetical protein BOTNAR_0003g00020 [Botryotinia narcissicola]|uniref:Uncharacterized protein n=1 Tax=Botryotinia narcissicola TaxID=278944 RepID=A0A4Z1J8R7_9HELO|nr:hypothetical protein BOTNAR_0003g00020 [Botryotinia narcissicola]
MSNYRGPNHDSLPAIPQPHGIPKYCLADPGHSTQMTPPYGQPNPPPSNHLATKYEARQGNDRSNEPRDKILYTVFYLCGQYRCSEAEPSDHYRRPKYTIQKSICQKYNNCEHCRTVQSQSGKFKFATDRERFRDLLRSELFELWTGKGGLFKDGFANSDNTPPYFDLKRIMHVILRTSEKLEDEIKMRNQKEEEQRQ